MSKKRMVLTPFLFFLAVMLMWLAVASGMGYLMVKPWEGYATGGFVIITGKPSENMDGNPYRYRYITTHTNENIIEVPRVGNGSVEFRAVTMADGVIYGSAWTTLQNDLAVMITKRSCNEGTYCIYTYADGYEEVFDNPEVIIMQVEVAIQEDQTLWGAGPQIEIHLEREGENYGTWYINTAP